MASKNDYIVHVHMIEETINQKSSLYQAIVHDYMHNKLWQWIYEDMERKNFEPSIIQCHNHNIVCDCNY